MRGERGAREQPAAADRRDDRVEARDLFDELERRGAGARDDVVVVERMDLDRARLGDHRATVATRASSVGSHSVIRAPYAAMAARLPGFAVSGTTT